MICPICTGDRVSRTFTLYDDRYGYRGEFEQRRCAACGHRWLDWTPDAPTLGKLYSEHYPRSDRSADDLAPLASPGRLAAWWRGARGSAARWVPAGVRVLDIGCGFGESLAYHRARGCEVHGVEADRNIARVAARHGFDVHVGLFEPERYAEAMFDYVTMDQVLEHAVDPIEMLGGVRRVLRAGGTTVLSTPNAAGAGARVFGARWINWHAPYHLHGFTAGSLCTAAERVGLRVARIETITSSEWLSYQWIHLVTAPPVGENSPFWAPARARGRRWTIRSLRAWHRTGVDHALTRLADSLGVGDNLIAVLERPAQE
jgi:2-polyprenyl-3-methyl-5-hydroxy-6-metoxy-1,4-benzoquinol methylase